MRRNRNFEQRPATRSLVNNWTSQRVTPGVNASMLIACPTLHTTFSPGGFSPASDVGRWSVLRRTVRSRWRHSRRNTPRRNAARASPGWPRRRREQCSADFVGRGAGRAPVPHGAVRSLCAVRSLRACRAGFLSYRSLRVRRVYRVLCTVSVPSEMKSICVCCPPLQRWLDAGRREFSPLKLLICCYYMAIEQSQDI